MNTIRMRYINGLVEKVHALAGVMPFAKDSLEAFGYLAALTAVESTLKAELEAE